jgi:tetratricopeptide (TPR) repeat protein
MTWEPAVELAIQRSGFWFIHLNRVAFWVLAALAAFLLALRFLGLRFGRGAFAASVRSYPTPRRLEWYGGGALLAFVCASYLALRPDPYFYSTLGRAALAQGDFGRARRYFEPLVAWGSRDPEVFMGLGISELQLGRPRAAATTMDRAIQLGVETSRAHLLRAYAARRLGEREQEVAHLRRAFALEADPAQRSVLERELRALGVSVLPPQ